MSVAAEGDFNIFDVFDAVEKFAEHFLCYVHFHSTLPFAEHREGGIEDEFDTC